MVDTAVFKTEALPGNAGSNPAGATTQLLGENMAARNQNMKALEALREQLKADIARLQNQLDGVEMSIRAVNGEVSSGRQTRVRAPRSNIKRYLLDLLKEAGAQGLNAAMAVETASKRGEQLERGTVSSLLSRLKGDGVVSYDGSVYRFMTEKAASGSDVKDPNLH